METQKKNNKKKSVIFAVIALAIAGIGAYFFISGANIETTDNAQIDADIVPIRSSVSGYVKDIFFEDNQKVKKGDLLITIDDKELRAKVAQAEAALENAKANLMAMKNNAKM